MRINTEKSKFISTTTIFAMAMLMIVVVLSTISTELDAATEQHMKGIGLFTIPLAYGDYNDDYNSNNGINWMKLCEMAPDFLVSEPCNELVDDNNELTSEGERVLLCLGGGTLAIIMGHPELLMLRSQVGCGGSGSSSGNGVINLLSSIFN